MPALVFVDLDCSGKWFCFRTPYNVEFVDALKITVPAANRRWRTEERVWCVTRKYWPSTERLLRKYYGEDVKIETGPTAEAAQIEVMIDQVSEPSARDYVVLGVRSDAPDCVVHAAYCALEDLLRDCGSMMVQEQGIYPLYETRPAYERICALRGIAPVPGRFPTYTMPGNEEEDVPF